MKNTILSLWVLFLINSLYAQAPAIQWQNSLGGSGNDYATSIYQIPTGEYSVGSYSNSTDGDFNVNTNGGINFYAMYLYSNGQKYAGVALGGTGTDKMTFMQRTSEGGFIFVGYSNSNDGQVSGNHGGYDYWVVKTSSLGQLQWQKSLGGSGDDFAQSISPTSDGGYIIAGYTNSNDGDVTGNHGGNDCWIVKLDTSGNLQWQKTFGGTGEDYANHCQQSSDGGYVFGATTFSNDGNVTGNHGGSDYWGVKLDALGNLLFQKCFGGTANDTMNYVTQTADGGYAMVGKTNSNDGDVSGNQGGADCWMIKIDLLGNTQWQIAFGGSGTDVAIAYQQTSDGGYIVAGYTDSTNGNVTGNHGGEDFWVTRLSASGSLTWQKALGGTGNERANFVQQTSDGGYVIAGYSNSNNGDLTFNHGGDDVWAVKLASDALGISSIETNQLTLYPNPTSTQLNLQLSNALTIDKINIVDVTGKTVVEETQNTHQLNVENLATGIYIVKAFSENQIFQTKFVKQ